jgi:predicted acetyltransferase
LSELLRDVPAEGLRYVEVTTQPGNVASRRVIERNGGVLVEEFTKLPAYGCGSELRYRIDIGPRDQRHEAG